ncbi:MAG: hypothetical protein IIA60_10810 [Candidatus Marinimicrobia bacterium]|nr:hypothetical protein [Candidatus Neomarinimicrobiota bacterium]
MIETIAATVDTTFIVNQVSVQIDSIATVIQAIGDSVSSMSVQMKAIADGDRGLKWLVVVAPVGAVLVAALLPHYLETKRRRRKQLGVIGGIVQATETLPSEAIKQADNVDSFVAKLNDDPFANPVMNYRASLSMNWATELPWGDAIQAVAEISTNTPEAIGLLSTIRKRCVTIARISEALFQEQQKFTEKKNEYIGSSENALREIERIILEYNGHARPDDPLRIELVGWIAESNRRARAGVQRELADGQAPEENVAVETEDAVSINPGTLEQTNQYYIQPLQILLRGFPDHELRPHLLHQIRKCEHEYLNYKALSSSVVANLTGIASTLRESGGGIKTTIGDFVQHLPPPLSDRHSDRNEQQ